MNNQSFYIIMNCFQSKWQSWDCNSKKENGKINSTTRIWTVVPETKSQCATNKLHWLFFYTDLILQSKGNAIINFSIQYCDVLSERESIKWFINHLFLTFWVKNMPFITDFWSVLPCCQKVEFKCKTNFRLFWHSIWSRYGLKVKGLLFFKKYVTKIMKITYQCY